MLMLILLFLALSLFFSLWNPLFSLFQLLDAFFLFDFFFLVHIRTYILFKEISC